jgi:hypothetical protein
MTNSENIVARYWSAYGGLRALYSSEYLWISIVLTIFLFPTWLNTQWWKDVLSIIPGLLGFSLGGFAMWVAIGDDKFKSLIAGVENDNEISSFMEINATFTHFILVQIIAILFSTFCKAYMPSDPNIIIINSYFDDCILFLKGSIYFLGYFLYIYALITALATVFALFRVSSWYDIMKTEELKKKKLEEEKKNKKRNH